MTSPMQCLKIGEVLPHGSIQEISETLTKKIKDGKLSFADMRTEVNYELVYRTMAGGVRKVRPVHEEIVKEAKRILKRHEIELPK